MSIESPRLKMLGRAGVVLLVAILGWGAWTGFKVWRAWGSVERVAFDVERAREELASASSTTSSPSTTTTTTHDNVSTTTVPPSTLDRGVLNSFLIIGTDERESSGPSLRADVILLVVLPPDSSDLIMMSIPRDLYVNNPCYGTKTKINANLNGCGDRVSGPELMAIAVEDYTGIAIDHFAIFGFEGFVDIIDTVGGVEVCVGDYPVRDSNVGLTYFELPAGCSIADGRQALGWIRSRHTLQLKDGRWTPVPGVTDLTRNERQQDLLITALERLKQVRDANELASLIEDIAGTFAFDDSLSLGDAIGIGWSLRSIAFQDIYRPTLQVSFGVTDDGASILVPVGSFEANVRAGYPNADLIYGPQA